MKLTLFLPILLFIAPFYSDFNPQEIIHISHDEINSGDTTNYLLDFKGIQPKSENNCVEFIYPVLNELKGDQPKILNLKPGTYHFYPEGSQQRNYNESNSTDINPRICAFLFEEIKNLVIEGNGCNLIFHGQMQPFTFDNCENITLSNVNIDWENPLIAQVQIKQVTDYYIDLFIDQLQFSYKIIDDKIFFRGDGWENQWNGTMEFDREGHFVVPQTGDWGCLGRNWNNYVAESIIPGQVRLNYNFERKPAVGNFLVMRHSERIHSGIFIQDSKKITIKDVSIFHATGLGILAQFSEDLTFDGYKPVPNASKRRYFGGGDDGLQISNCKGQITVTNCEFAGLMDDPINVHGTSVQVIEILSENKLKCKFMHSQSEGMNWGHPADKIGFIENRSMKTFAFGEIEKFEKLNVQEFILTFSEPVPKELEVEDALENLTWSPDFTVTNSRFKSCRARGLLVSTPGKVIIENNIFESSGSAILIAGDANNWFESGAVNDVLIKDNIFTDLCNTSSYQFCEGIISIYPEIPELNKNTPYFHRNIQITENQFNPFDFPILFARSVNGISFTKNRIVRSFRFEPYHNRKYSFSFEACKNITIQENRFGDEVLGKNILLKFTDKKELNCDQEELSIKVQ